MGTASRFTECVAPLHRALAQELSWLAEAVPGVAAGDEAAARALGTWSFDVVDALHHYLRALESWVRPVIDAHEGEDDYAAEVLRAVARDQAALESAVQRALAAAVRWQDGAATADRDALAVHLRRLRSGTAVAFARIDGDLAPLADPLIDGPRVAAVTRHPAAALGGRRGRALTGAVLTQVAPTDDGAGARSPARHAIRLQNLVARREYRRRTAALRSRLP